MKYVIIITKCGKAQIEEQRRFTHPLQDSVHRCVEWVSVYLHTYVCSYVLREKEINFRKVVYWWSYENSFCFIFVLCCGVQIKVYFILYKNNLFNIELTLWRQ